MNRPLIISLIFWSLFVISEIEVNAQTNTEPKISGTIFFTGETYLDFEDILYIHGFIAPTSRLNRYKAFKVIYNNTIRVISITSLKFIRVDDYKLDMGQDGTIVIRNSKLKIETKTRESIEMPYFELGWILVKVKDPKSNREMELKIPFVENNELKIEKIIFD
ncbi:MAG: hypothetical protein CVV23_06270 [Ignavibacteriae bacterium HGW-Ignavibacteriae-2]|jgi:hypothetical protein|nr:hypothetical protein [Bacteroidota bacterium]PKL89249.1 MAG: hypothetical protein CVV23_06270 [Ignavibacteriae bacterium HGW-Ignavibacteriae-2]